MNIWTWRPALDPLSELQRHVDRLFDFTALVGRQFWQSWRPFPPYNLYEAPSEFVIIAPLTGVNPEDLEVSIAGNALIVKGERKRSDNVADEQYRRQERWQGKWSRAIPIPDKADASQVSASLDNGLLTIRMPKVLESLARHVPVTVTQSQQSPLSPEGRK
jgi:HSP20 family protein